MLKKTKIDVGIVSRIWIYAKPYGKYLLPAVISAFISVILTLSCSVIIGKAVDLIVGESNVNFKDLSVVIINFTAVFAGGAAFQWCAAYLNNIITYKTVKDLRIKLFCKLNKISFKYIDSVLHGDIINRVVNDIDNVSDALLKSITQLFTGVITILGTLVFMFAVNPLITAAVALLTPLSLFAASFIARRCFKYFKEQSIVQSKLTGYINEYIGNLKLVKTFNHETESQKGFEEINSELYDRGFKGQFFSSLTNPCTRFINGLVYASVGVIGALNVIGGNITVGGLSMFLTYANQYTKPFNEISGIMAQLQSAFASARRVFEIIDLPEETDDENAIDNTELKGNVKLDNVYFSYDKNIKLIENLSIDAPQGSRIAIIGPTGCGKTTLINLLMRFYDTDSGKITVDGTDIMDMNRNSLRRNYGMVLQDAWLFTGTVRENLAYGIDVVDDNKIEIAARYTHAHNFIKNLPDGYDTIISEDGGNLSQGQKQLLCVTRVMLLDAPMLILDEATSNIDTRTEIFVQRAFAEMMKGRTSFIVAHRLSTIKDADLILVMNSGKIVEQGTHDELIKLRGFYFQFYNYIRQ